MFVFLYGLEKRVAECHWQQVVDYYRCRSPRVRSRGHCLLIHIPIGEFRQNIRRNLSLDDRDDSKDHHEEDDEARYQERE